MKLSIELERHDGTRLRVMESTYVDKTRDVKQIVVLGCAFAHIAGLEIYVSVDGGKWMHYPNVEFLSFIEQLIHNIKRAGKPNQGE